MSTEETSKPKTGADAAEELSDAGNEPDSSEFTQDFPRSMMAHPLGLAVVLAVGLICYGIFVVVRVRFGRM
ncbi:DUF1206 domain-containing protein [Arthrobacter sp. TMN-50]